MPKYTLKDQMFSGKKLDLELEVSGVTPTPQDLKVIAALLYFGEKAKLHQTSKAQNMPSGAKGYLHVDDNRLLAVKSFTEGKVTAGKITTAAKMEIFPAIGKVKSGVHRF